MSQEKIKAHVFTRTLWGIIIIVFGLLFLLQELGANLEVGKFWPIILLVPGVAFWLLFFSKRDQSGMEGVLIPGTILSLLGLYFLFESLTNWRTSEQTGFVYTLIVSLAFFAVYFLGDQSRGYAVTAWILLAVSAIILFSTSVRFNIWPVILILAGAWLIWRPSRKKAEEPSRGQTIPPAENPEA